jgi:hypothetical protein
MSSLKLEKLEDLLSIDTDKLKSQDKTKLLTRLKALIKLGDKMEARSDEEAMKLPYEAISVIGTKLITLRFDLESKEGRVIDVEEDARKPVIGMMAMNKVKSLAKSQLEKKDV